MDWKSIETAPRDGTKVLASTPAGILIVWWTDVGDFDGEHKGWSADRVQSWNYQETCEEFPTHWMPLPEPAR